MPTGRWPSRCIGRSSARINLAKSDGRAGASQTTTRPTNRATTAGLKRRSAATSSRRSATSTLDLGQLGQPVERSARLHRAGSAAPRRRRRVAALATGAGERQRPRCDVFGPALPIGLTCIASYGKLGAESEYRGSGGVP
jgi:hypothetical protein